MSEKQAKKEEKPKLELLEAKELYAVALCNPVKDQLNQIKVCGPNIEVKVCGPVERVRCLPDIWCRPLIFCQPDLWCLPKVWCIPIVVGPCLPSVGPCGPWVEGPCGPSVVQLPPGQLEEITARVDKLTAEIEALKKKVSK